MTERLRVCFFNVWRGQTLGGRALRTALLAYLALRSWTLLFGAISVMLPEIAAPRDGYILEQLRSLQTNSQFSRLLLAPWYRWDTMGYLTIAAKGYAGNPTHAVWPPLYPGLVAFWGLIFSSPMVGALLVSNLAVIVGFVLLYWMVNEYLGEKAAARSVWLLATFPTAFYLVAGYSESLFIALMLASLWAGHKGRWVWAGVAGMLAAMCRTQGLLLVLPLGWELLSSLRGIPPGKRLGYLLTGGAALSLLPLSFVAYTLYIYHDMGGRWIWEILGSGWGQHWAWPWQGALSNFAALVGAQPVESYANPLSTSFDFLVGVTFPVLLILAAWKLPRLPFSYHLASWVFLLVTMAKVDAAGMYVSQSRYVLPVFLAYPALAFVVNKQWAWRAWIFFGLASLAILTFAFGRWIWVA